MIDDGLITATLLEQEELEARILQLYRDFGDFGGLDADDPDLILTRKQHAKYLAGGLGELPPGFISLDASRAWICYWVTHALALLGKPLPAWLPKAAVVDFLASCQHPEGGFGGGPYQLPHLAPTYAAVAALVTLGGKEALELVDRPKLWRYLLSMCVPPSEGGGMTMHQGGEVDVRGCYCALATAHMLNLDKQALAEACGLVQYVRACQSYEGGLGGEPWNEAHGGYTFCGVAALALAGRADALDLASMLRWAAGMQGSMEGGFMGRTNKLVDGCYSFWQGAAFPLISQQLLEQQRALAAAAAAGGASAAAARRQRQLPLSAAEQQAAAAAAAAAAQRLLSGEAEAYVAALAPLAPVAAAEAALAAAQVRLDETVDESLQAEDRAKAAAAAHDEHSAELEQEASAALDRAAEAQQAVERATGQLEVARCSAATLLPPAAHAAAAALPLGGAQGQGPASSAPGAGGDGSGSESRREGAPDGPVLYNPTALQLWLLKCCQAPRGGLRDKPGKPADYYHTCYCLSGLASCQQHSGVVLGGEDNRLEAADPLCNVVADRLAEALEYYGSLPVPR